MDEESGGERTGVGGDAPTAPPALPGYEVLGPLGVGATPSVWRARRRADGLVVAVKVLRPAGGDVAAGLHAAGLLTRVRHRHVAHLYDVLPLPDPVTGRPVAVALAAQLAGGGSLSQLLARRRVLSPGELVTALQPLAGALADLHGTGVVHGDLSTGNVLFLRDGMPVLGDLGTASISGAWPGSGAVGDPPTAGMVAPEVLEGFAPTPESDVYQLGALAWRCLTGEPPGPPDDRGELTEVVPGLPPELADTITRCLAAEPEARPDAEEVALVLLSCAAPEPVEVVPDADPAHGLTERLRSQARADLDAGPGGGRSGGRGSHRAGPRRVLVPAVLAAASLLLLVAALVVVRPPLVGAPASDAAPGRVVHEVRPEVAPTTGPAEGPPPGEPGQATTGPEDDRMTEVLQGLLDGRGEAWERADTALLVGVVAPGSPAEASDTEQLARLRETGARYPDVTFRVEGASVEDDAVADERTDGTQVVRLRATITRAALEGRGSAGERLPTLPVSTERVALELARVGERWLLWSWGPASTG